MTRYYIYEPHAGRKRQFDRAATALAYADPWGHGVETREERA